MSNVLADRLQQIVNEMRAGSGAAGVKESEPDTGQEMKNYLTPDNLAFAKDYYIVGRVSAMAGTLKYHYDQGALLLSRMTSGSGIPLHFSVFKPAPVTAYWSAAITSAADIGWVDGSQYQPNTEPGTSFKKWVAYGCPHENQYGKYTNTGDFVNETHHFSPGP